MEFRLRRKALSVSSLLPALRGATRYRPCFNRAMLDRCTAQEAGKPKLSELTTGLSSDHFASIGRLYRCSTVSAFGGFFDTCAGVGNCDTSQPPPRAWINSIEATAS